MKTKQSHQNTSLLSFYSSPELSLFLTRWWLSVSLLLSQLTNSLDSNSPISPGLKRWGALKSECGMWKRPSLLRWGTTSRKAKRRCFGRSRTSWARTYASSMFNNLHPVSSNFSNSNSRVKLSSNFQLIIIIIFADGGNSLAILRNLLHEYQLILTGAGVSVQFWSPCFSCYGLIHFEDYEWFAY